ncbi:MAG: hypothetical protein O7C72_11325 [Deltaproteobacteria bacterium]|nr:hypothetical protein [Deltaproteobacteria bacterium]
MTARIGRPWIGVERDQSQVRVAARRLRLRRIVSREGKKGWSLADSF